MLGDLPAADEATLVMVDGLSSGPRATLTGAPMLRGPWSTKVAEAGTVTRMDGRPTAVAAVTPVAGVIERNEAICKTIDFGGTAMNDVAVGKVVMVRLLATDAVGWELTQPM